MKIILLCLVITIFSGCQRENQPPQPPFVFEVEMHKEWCVNVCMGSFLKDFQSKGDSWGTSSSSMNGLSEDNIFTKIKGYCENIYANSCLHVKYPSNKRIHVNGGSYAGRALNND